MFWSLCWPLFALSPVSFHMVLVWILPCVCLISYQTEFGFVFCLLFCLSWSSNLFNYLDILKYYPLLIVQWPDTLALFTQKSSVWLLGTHTQIKTQYNETRVSFNWVTLVPLPGFNGKKRNKKRVIWNWFTLVPLLVFNGMKNNHTKNEALSIDSIWYNPQYLKKSIALTKNSSDHLVLDARTPNLSSLA